MYCRGKGWDQGQEIREMPACIYHFLHVPEEGSRGGVRDKGRGRGGEEGK